MIKKMKSFIFLRQGNNYIYNNLFISLLNIIRQTGKYSLKKIDSFM